MQRVYITRGVPGSGKSTWARRWALEEPTKRVIVNRDSIRHMLGQYWVLEREALVSEMEFALVLEAIDRGYDVVIDATGFNNMFLNYFYRVKVVRNLKVIIKDFTNIPLHLCIERDSKRTAPVGEQVIMGMAKKYLKHETKRL